MKKESRDQEIAEEFAKRKRQYSRQRDFSLISLALFQFGFFAWNYYGDPSLYSCFAVYALCVFWAYWIDGKRKCPVCHKKVGGRFDVFNTYLKLSACPNCGAKFEINPLNGEQ